MYSILINAYACSPGMGSEPGMAWNWCINLAKYCELHIITEGEFRDKIEAVLPELPQGKNMHFYYNPVSDNIRKMCWNQGDWRFYRYYRKWQWKTYLIAKEICEHSHIDIIHQLNMIGFREPGYLWKIENVPFVWGPVDAKETFPDAFLERAGYKTKVFIRLKNFLTKLQLKYSTRVKEAVKRASLVISASSNSEISFKKYFGIDTPLLNETGCYESDVAIESDTEKTCLDILWVGKLDFRKQLGLALRSIAATKNKSVFLHIVGGGDQGRYKLLASSLDIEAQCKWYGNVSHDEVQRIMQCCDLLLFTSVAEGTPHVVLESFRNMLPVLCFETCGQGDCVNDSAGIKIALSDPKSAEIEFAQKINYLYAHRDVLHRLSLGCKQRQKELSWDSKARRMVELYKESLTDNS